MVDEVQKEVVVDNREGLEKFTRDAPVQPDVRPSNETPTETPTGLSDEQRNLRFAAQLDFNNIDKEVTDVQAPGFWDQVAWNIVDDGLTANV